MRSVSWRSLQGVGVIVALSSLVACGGEKAQNTDSAAAAMSAPAMESMSSDAGKWTTTLESKGGTMVVGTASAMPGSTPGTTAVEIAITGAPANGVHPWHVHVGSCSSGGDIVGPPTDYAPLTADANGAATSMATVNVPAPTSGDFHVNVHMSPTDLGTIVACGDLKMGAM